MTLTITSKTTRGEALDELERTRKELADFKRQVVDVALEAKADFDWCSEGFRDTMTTLGLEKLLPATERIVVLKVRVDADEACLEVSEMDDEDWASAAISKVQNLYHYDLHGYSVEDVPQDK